MAATAKASALLMAQSHKTGPHNRMRCTSRTTWDHRNLEEYLHVAPHCNLFVHVLHCISSTTKGS
jgi:hypothetical protein